MPDFCGWHVQSAAVVSDACLAKKRRRRVACLAMNRAIITLAQSTTMPNYSRGTFWHRGDFQVFANILTCRFNKRCQSPTCANAHELMIPNIGTDNLNAGHQLATGYTL
jgi:hypothetical protein